MSNQLTPTFSFSHTIDVLNLKATLEINESSFVLSEKSLYGAGTTRYQSQVSIILTDLSGDSVTRMTRMNQEQQNVIDLESDISKEEQAKLFLFNYFSNSIFFNEDESFEYEE